MSQPDTNPGQFRFLSRALSEANPDQLWTIVVGAGRDGALMSIGAG
ncbi:hypothetical protein HZA86_02885 [Candidatus Uhrbacteria bacterium]|nr:hypothetical protein [Candidatus Uhrbacteria bacterium]